MSQVTLTNVTKKWGDTVAVDDVSFTAEPGELLVLLGPSGCGKSTTLRLIAGLEEVSTGTIHVGENDVTHMPPAKRNLSMVFQSYALFPHLTVAENMIFGLRVRKVDAHERTKRLTEVSQVLGLEELLDRKPSQLSGGQQQRVALGRAIVSAAPLCLMDEPLSNLDAKLRNAMRTEIRNIQRRFGITMIYVTHDQTEAMTMADQVILQRQGQVEQMGTPEDLYARPVSAFAARFIGTPPMNLLELSEHRGEAVISGTEGPRVLEGPGNGILLGVRPEHVRLSDGSGIPAKVVELEHHGADSILACKVGSQMVLLRTEGWSPIQPGADVRIHWRTEHVHVFDGGSGRRPVDAGRAIDVTQRVA